MPQLMLQVRPLMIRVPAVHCAGLVEVVLATLEVVVTAVVVVVVVAVVVVAATELVVDEPELQSTVSSPAAGTAAFKTFLK